MAQHRADIQGKGQDPTRPEGNGKRLKKKQHTLLHLQVNFLLFSTFLEANPYVFLIGNVLQMLQVLKMSTWLSVTHLPNKTQSLTNGGTEIHRPVTENQVVKMSTSFFRNASRPVENQVPPPGT